MKKLFFLLIILVFIYSCKKDSKNIFSASTKKINITGITCTDPNGQEYYTYGNVDKDDWKEDKTPTNDELNLLNFKDTVDYSNLSDTTTILRMNFYPNPFCSVAIFSLLSSSNNVVLKCAIVDEYFKVYMTFHSNNKFVLWNNNFSNGLYTRGNFYRMYYGVYGKDKKLLYFGHGDIWYPKNTPFYMQGCGCNSCS